MTYLENSRKPGEKVNLNNLKVPRTLVRSTSTFKFIHLFLRVINQSSYGAVQLKMWNEVILAKRD